MTEILLTGSTGSIGRRLKGLPSLEFDLDMDELEILKKMPQVNTLIHLASPTRTAEVAADLNTSRRRILDASLNLFRALSKRNGELFVFASTAHVYGAVPSYSPIEESTIPNPVGVYGQLKLETENLLMEEQRKLGLSLVICRIFSVFGPNIAPHYLYSRVRRECQLKAKSKIENALDVRDFVSPSFVANTVLKLAILKKSGTYNVCSGVGTTVQNAVLGLCPEWPNQGFDFSYSEMPFLVGSNLHTKNTLASQEIIFRGTD